MDTLLNIVGSSPDLVERTGFDSDSKPGVIEHIKTVLEIIKNPLGFCYVVYTVRCEQNLRLLDQHERMDWEIKNLEHKNYFV